MGCAQGQQERHRQPATRRIAAYDDLLGLEPLLEQPPIGGPGILQRGGEGVFGGQPVGRGKDPGRRGRREVGNQRPVAPWRPGDVAAAVEVEQHPVGARVGHGQPLTVESAQVHHTALNRQGGGQ